MAAAGRRCGRRSATRRRPTSGAFAAARGAARRLAGAGRLPRPVRLLRPRPRRRRRPRRSSSAGSAPRPRTCSTSSSPRRSPMSEANTPSLEGFLAWLEAADTDIKPRHRHAPRRGAGDDRPRRQGPRGATIVFLVDNGSPPVHPNHDPKVVSLADDRDGDARAAGLGAERAHRRRRRSKARIDALRADAEEEYRRLLYVAHHPRPRPALSSAAPRSRSATATSRSAGTR